MAKNRVIIKIVILIAILTYLLLGGPLVVLGNTTEEKVTNNIRNNITNNITNSVTNSVESNKDKEPITISVRNGSLRETVLGICRSYGISVIGVESLKGNITATVKGESPEEVIKELGRIYHFLYQNNIIHYLLNLMKQHWRTENSMYYLQNTYQQNL